MAESEEELKSLLKRVKEKSEKAGFKLNIQKTKIMTSSPIASWRNRWRNNETVRDVIFLVTKITADDDFSHEIKRHFLLGRKAMTNLGNLGLKSRDISSPTKIHLFKAMVFPVVMYGCESWTVKKTELWRIDAFEGWCWRRERPLDYKELQSVLKEFSPEYSLRDWWCSWNSNTLATWWEELTHLKRPWCWERLKVGREGDDRGWDGWIASST